MTFWILKDCDYVLWYDNISTQWTLDRSEALQFRSLLEAQRAAESLNKGRGCKCEVIEVRIEVNK